MLGALATAGLLAGCALPLKHPGAQLDLPASWAEAVPAGAAGQPAEPDWWRAFASAELEALIATALSGSPDLAVATERVLQAEIAVRSAGASLFPALDLNVTTGARDTRQDGTTTRTENSSAALAVSYEIDVWGSNIANWQGNKATLAATRFDYEATRLSLAAGVANAYWQVLVLRDRLAIARQNLEIAERLFAIVEARYRHGAASALDLSRQRSTVLSARDALLPLEVQERQSLRALALLVGRVPQGFDVAARGLDGLAVPEITPALPGELLVRRPDLAAAEARLAAADANIAVARAALFPLKLSIGLSSTLTSGEFALLGLGSPANAAGLTVSLMQALFDGGRLRGQVESSESQRRVLVENWRKAVLTSLKEVDDALSIAERGRVQEITQSEIRDETARALRLSEVRYKEGSDGLSTLLDAQRSLFSAEDQLVQQRAVRLGAAVDVYKALGGGWRVDEPAYRQAGNEPAS
ncbi:efflux transporter outer membrane subunit [Pseudothauera nasutitermitis]|nr:efflux transporter outer membrane subunit [Pseudothauera nasutitermitis]